MGDGYVVSVSGNDAGMEDTGMPAPDMPGAVEGMETGGTQGTAAGDFIDNAVTDTGTGTDPQGQGTELPYIPETVTVPEPYIPETATVPEPYIPGDLTESLGSLVMLLREGAEEHTGIFYGAGHGDQWTVTFLGRNCTVYSYDPGNGSSNGYFLQAGDGNWVGGGQGSLTFYEEYLFWMSGTVSGCGVRVLGTDGGYTDDFTACSDGMYVLADDAAVYEEWLAQKADGEEEGAASGEYSAAVLKQLEDLNAAVNTMSGNSIDYYGSASLYHGRALEAQAVNAAAGIAGGFFGGIACGLLAAGLAWRKMH